MDRFDYGIKWIAAEMIAQALEHLSSNNIAEKEDAVNWINKNSNEAFGFKWCISACGVSGNLIRSYITEILEHGKTFKKLRKYSLPFNKQRKVVGIVEIEEVEDAA